MKKIIATTLLSSALLTSAALADDDHNIDFSQVKVDIKQAIDIANDTVQGNVTEISIDSEDGVNVWEVEVLDQDKKDHEIKIDASTGEVISQEMDS